MRDHVRRRSGRSIAARLAGLVLPMLPIMAVAILMGVAGFLCAILIPVSGGYALLHLSGYTLALSLRAVFWFLIGFAALRGVLRYAEQACNHYIAFKLLAMIRDKVFRALRRLAPAKLETKERGNLIAMITTDIELLEVFYAHTLSPVAIAVLVSALMAALLARYHWLLAAIALCGYVAVGVVIPMAISRAGRQAGMAYREESGALGSALLDSLRGLREVLQFQQGPSFLEGIRARTEALGKKQAQMKRYEGVTGALSNAAILICSLTVLLCGAALHQGGVLGLDGVVIGFVATISSFGPVLAIANLSNNLLQTFAAADRVLDILDEAPALEEVRDGIDPGFTGMACEHVSFGYGQERVLEDISLDIRQRHIIGLQGKSGSGKSTLMRLLMRFWDTDEGSVLMSGHDVREINTRTLRHNQGFVTQDSPRPGISMGQYPAWLLACGRQPHSQVFHHR